MTEGTLANGQVMGADSDAVRALIRSSRRAERIVSLCLRGDLVAQFEQLDRQLVAFTVRRTVKDDRLNSPAVDPRAVAIAEQMEALRQEMQSSTVDFRVRALSEKRWAELRAEYPPRKGDDGKPHPDDAAIGVDTTRFWEPLVRECLVAPVIDAETWEILMGRGTPTEEDPEADQHGLSSAQWDELCGAAWAINRGKVDIPFSSAASRILGNSEPTSTRPTG